MGIKRYSGFVTSDGSTFPTEKEALEYEGAAVIKAQVEAQFSADAFAEAFNNSVDFEGAGIHSDDHGHAAIYSEGVADFIFTNRKAIMVALTLPKAVKRGAYRPRAAVVKKVKAADTPAAASAPAAAQVRVHSEEGMGFMDDDGSDLGGIDSSGLDDGRTGTVVPLSVAAAEGVAVL